MATENTKVKTSAVHIVLQGKGGVGKSFVSSILGQYFRSKRANLYCFDTDPVNPTFAQYKALGAEHLQIVQRGVIHEKQFDELVAKICAYEGTFVVDTGATTFLPIWNYILENEVLKLLADRSRKVFIHSIVTGGQALTDTLNGFGRVAKTTTEKNMIVWLNEFFGEVRRDGKSFTDFHAVKENAEKLLGAVLIPERNPNTYGDDVKQMLEERLTFEEAIRSETFSLVAKQRLEITRRDLFQQLDQIGLG